MNKDLAAFGIHLCFNDVEHVGSAASQPVWYPDVNSGARQPAGTLVYGLEPHKDGKR